MSVVNALATTWLSLLVIVSCEYNSFVCYENGLVEQIDHVIMGTTSSSPQNVGTVYNILSSNLSFPIVWNYEYYDHQDVYKGGLSLGNLNIEFIYSSSNAPNGMALSPCFTDLIIIRSQFYQKNVIQNISERLAFSSSPNQNFLLFDMNNIVNNNFDNGSKFFVCNYLFNQNLRRFYFWKQLASNNGGKLGIQYVEYVVINVNISCNDKAMFIQNWSNILFPYKLECDAKQTGCHQTQCKVNNFGGGPDLMMQINTNNNNHNNNSQSVDMVVVRVRNINDALSVLKEMNLNSDKELPPPFQNCIEMSFEYYGVNNIAKLVLC